MSQVLDQIFAMHDYKLCWDHKTLGLKGESNWDRIMDKDLKYYLDKLHADDKENVYWFEKI